MPNPKPRRELTIRAKALTAFLALSGVAAFVGAFGLTSTRALTAEVRRLAGDRLPAVEGLGKAQNAVTAIQLDTARAIDDSVLGRQIAYADAFHGRESDRARAMQGMAKFGELTLTPEEQAIWEPLDSALNTFVVADKEIWEAIRTHDVPTAVKLQGELGPRTAKELTEPLQALVELQGKMGDRISLEADERATWIQRGLWVVIAVTLTAAAVLALLLTRSITRPLRRLA